MSENSFPLANLCNGFYEKVIKVKADVAAYLRLIAFHLHNPPVVTWGAVKGAPEQGAFILTLDSSPRHLQSSWERSATQFSWASFLSGFGFSSYWHAFRNASELSASIIPVRSQKYIDRRFVPCVSQSLACNHHSCPASIRTLKEPHGARCTLGFDLKPGPITTVTGPGCLGAAICLAISMDLAITRSHPNKASGCRCGKLFR